MADIDYDPSGDSEDRDKVWCDWCAGTGISIEGWDCEECDGLGYWDF